MAFYSGLCAISAGLSFLVLVSPCGIQKGSPESQYIWLLHLRSDHSVPRSRSILPAGVCPGLLASFKLGFLII